jgi:hypothetical protein
MNKHAQRNLGKIIALSVLATLVFAGCKTHVGIASTDTEIIHVTVATLTNACAGKYYAYAKMTNEVGNFWIKPPTNIVVTSGTLTDMSGFATPYASYATVLKFGTTTFLCGSNTVTFPATNGASYQLMVIVTSRPPPPTNNQPMTLHVDWNP